MFYKIHFLKNHSSANQSNWEHGLILGKFHFNAGSDKYLRLQVLVLTASRYIWQIKFSAKIANVSIRAFSLNIDLVLKSRQFQDVHCCSKIQNMVSTKTIDIGHYNSNCVSFPMSFNIWTTKKNTLLAVYILINDTIHFTRLVLRN